jgi:ATP-dependent RNA helicase RhlE
MNFQELNLIDPLLRAVHAEGYDTPTPIQQQAIPHILAGRDMIGCAQTGTGKTAAFALPILQRLIQTPPARPGRNVRALILSPTRELSAQIKESFSSYGRHTPQRAIVIFGGVGQTPQVEALKRGADILVATPGRLLDLMQQGIIRLNTIEIFVLDEADRMLDMGFIHDVKKVVAALPAKRQTLLFSATMPDAVQDLANRMLTNPVRVEVTPPATTVEKIAQSVYFVSKANKRPLLEHLLNDQSIRRVLVFTRTKHGANKLAEQLERAEIHAEAIHGNKSQTARERALANFKAGRTRVLVATDIAARGIDVDDVTHVINYELPNEPESYVHRIGRTARAGASGSAFSFCDHDEKAYLRDIEKLIRIRIPVIEDHPFKGALTPATTPEAAPPRRSSNDYSRSNDERRRNGQHAQRNASTKSGNAPRQDGTRAAQDVPSNGEPRRSTNKPRPNYNPRRGRTEHSLE